MELQIDKGEKYYRSSENAAVVHGEGQTGAAEVIDGPPVHEVIDITTISNNITT